MENPLTDDDLDLLEAKAQEGVMARPGDVLALVAEVRRLRDSKRELKQALVKQSQAINDEIDEVYRLRARLSAIRAICD